MPTRPKTSTVPMRGSWLNGIQVKEPDAALFAFLQGQD
jgi:hypothetical protein